MDVRIVGASQTESAGARGTSLIVDDSIAIDAGSLAGVLSLDQQRALDAVLITHYHFDHISTLPTIALNRLGHASLPVYTLPEVRDALQRHIFNDLLWPNFETMPSADAPTMRYTTVVPGIEFQLGPYCVTPIPANHTAPTVGYAISKGDRSVFYTGDTHGGNPSIWPLVQPDLLIVETTFPNRLDAVAQDARHLTPARLGRELDDYRAVHRTVPRVAVIHVNREFKDEIAAELAGEARRLGASIHIAEDGERFSI